MRRLEQRIPCKDEAGRRYVVEVFVSPVSATTYSGVYELWRRRECWLRTGDCYQPINVVEALEVFMLVDQGRIVTLHRARKPGRLPSLLRLPAWTSLSRIAAGQGWG